MPRSCLRIEISDREVRRTAGGNEVRWLVTPPPHPEPLLAWPTFLLAGSLQSPNETCLTQVSITSVDMAVLCTKDRLHPTLTSQCPTRHAKVHDNEEANLVVGCGIESHHSRFRSARMCIRDSPISSLFLSFPIDPTTDAKSFQHDSSRSSQQRRAQKPGLCNMGYSC